MVILCFQQSHPLAVVAVRVVIRLLMVVTAVLEAVQITQVHPAVQVTRRRCRHLKVITEGPEQA